MKKQAVALVGILQLVLGLVLAYQAGFASGGVFAPQSLKPNDIFYGQSYYMYADFNPTSATIPTGSSQTYTIALYDSQSGIPLPDDYASFSWSVDGVQVASGGAGMETFSVSGLGVGTHSVECDASNYDSNNGWDYVSCTASLTVTGQSTPAPTSQATYSAYAGDGTEVGTATVTVQDLTRGTSATGVGYSGSLSVGLGDSLRFSCTVPNGYGFVYWSGTSYSAVNPMIVVVSGNNVFEDCYYGVVTNPTPTPTATPPGQTPSPTPHASPTPSLTYNVHMIGYQQAGIGGFSWTPQGTYSGQLDTWSFNSGTVVTLSATASSGYTFNYWVINGVQYVGSSGQWTITSTTTIQAVFLSISATPTPTSSGNPQASPTPTPMPLPTATPYNPNQTPNPYQNNPTPTPIVREISSAELSTFVLFAVGVSLVCSGLLTTGMAFKVSNGKRKP